MTQRELSGILFKNDRKVQDNHPDRQGSCMIDGVEYWISAWDKSGQKGPFLSLAFKKKDVKAQVQSMKEMVKSSAPPEPEDSELPF